MADLYSCKAENPLSPLRRVEPHCPAEASQTSDPLPVFMPLDVLKVVGELSAAKEMDRHEPPSGDSGCQLLEIFEICMTRRVVDLHQDVVALQKIVIRLLCRCSRYSDRSALMTALLIGEK